MINGVNFKRKRTNMMDQLTSLVRCNSYDEKDAGPALDKALAQVGGLGWVQKGMRVVIKPNLIMMRRPESAAVTHPAFVKALAERLIERGAEVIVGDSPGGPFAEVWLKAVYDGTRMSELKRSGAILNYNTGVKNVRFPEGKALKDLTVAEFVLGADALISFAKLKTHTFMQYTGAVKNLFGVIPGTLKAEYHQRMSDPRSFANMLVDISEFIKPTLSFIDAVVGMEGNGPSGGTPKHVGALIASTSPHHADLVGAALMGLESSEVLTLQCAIERGLCSGSAPDVKSCLDIVRSMGISRFKMPDTASGKSLFDAGFIRKIFQSDPYVNEDDCLGCGTCEKACPPKAIIMANKIPRFDRKKCIHCYCCHELCPKTAISLKRTRIAEFLQGQSKR
jgi:uncharacterized protein (DUF362 family)/Pyruvate/2-oxoacid:ferredoxin oxidoreductase delta subunit